LAEELADAVTRSAFRLLSPEANGAAFRPQVDDPVGLGDHVEVVLDHDDAVAGVDQPMQHADQLLDVGHVQAHRRLVEHVERVRRLLAARVTSSRTLPARSPA
jgi:hypothetical protein